MASAGGVPVFVPLGLESAVLRSLFSRLDGILLSGGGDVNPAHKGEEIEHLRDQLELTLARLAIESPKPILGICRGLQVLNVAHGGTLIRDIATEWPGALDHQGHDNESAELVHGVGVELGSLLYTLTRSRHLSVNSSHHQAVKEIAPGWRVAAQAEDRVIEALELPGHPFALGVQWHPERLLNRSESRALFAGLTRAAAE